MLKKQSRVVQRMEQGLVSLLSMLWYSGPPPPPGHSPPTLALSSPPMVPHPCPVRKATICAVISCIRHELQRLIMRVVLRW